MKRSTPKREGTTLRHHEKNAQHRDENAPLLAIERNGRGPLWRQLYTSLRMRILTGALAAGSKLPSTRSLARALNVSRNTVIAAYDALADDGLIAAATGSCTRVCGTPLGTPPLAPTLLDYARFCREAQFPLGAVRFEDADGNALYLHR